LGQNDIKRWDKTEDRRQDKLTHIKIGARKSAGKKLTHKEEEAKRRRNKN
jgi:hypothetical protein